MNYKTFNRKLRHVVSVPFIWMMLFPVIILDFFLEIYHRICFPLYGIEYVNRKSHLKLDRYKLNYLRWYDKINCLYCEYVNGLFHYASEIGARTESYWCGIKHNSDRENFNHPKHHENFIEYGDKETYCKLGENKKSK